MSHEPRQLGVPFNPLDENDMRPEVLMDRYAGELDRLKEAISGLGLPFINSGTAGYVVSTAIHFLRQAYPTTAAGEAVGDVSR
jgi:hypothetical protein